MTALFGSPLFEYPKNAEFGRIVAKSKIFERVKPNRKCQDAFASQVKKIVWRYKLASSTTNLKETRQVKEIEIFELVLKSKNVTGSMDKNILRCIDKAIAHPIIFHLCFADKTKVIACYKRPGEADANKWVLSEGYFESDWLPVDTAQQQLPVVLNLSRLYEHILQALIPLPAREKESLEQYIERADQVTAKYKEYEKLEARISKEKQYNRKVEINQTLNKLKVEIRSLKNG